MLIITLNLQPSVDLHCTVCMSLITFRRVHKYLYDSVLIIWSIGIIKKAIILIFVIDLEISYRIRLLVYYGSILIEFALC